MSEPGTEVLQRLVHDVFGRDLAPERVELLRPRLLVMLRNVELLESWSAALGRTEPAAVHATPPPDGDGDG